MYKCTLMTFDHSRKHPLSSVHATSTTMAALGDSLSKKLTPGDGVVDEMASPITTSFMHSSVWVYLDALGLASWEFLDKHIIRWRPYALAALPCDQQYEVPARLLLGILKWL